MLHGFLCGFYHFCMQSFMVGAVICFHVHSRSTAFSFENSQKVLFHFSLATSREVLSFPFLALPLFLLQHLFFPTPTNGGAPLASHTSTRKTSTRRLRSAELPTPPPLALARETASATGGDPTGDPSRGGRRCWTRRRSRRGEGPC